MRARALRGARSSFAVAPRRDRSRRVERHPVADDRKGPSIGLAPQAARDAASSLARLDHQVVLAAMLHRDACGHEARSRVRLERGAPVLVPAELLEFGHATILTEASVASGASASSCRSRSSEPRIRIRRRRDGPEARVGRRGEPPRLSGRRARGSESGSGQDGRPVERRSQRFRELLDRYRVGRREIDRACQISFEGLGVPRRHCPPSRSSSTIAVPLPTGPPTPSRKEGSIGLQRASVARQHDALPKVHDAHAGVPSGCEAASVRR